MGTWEGAIVSVLALGLCDGFAGPCINFYYLGLKRSEQIGEGTAIAYYELATKIGDTLGPMILATCILIAGNQKGILIVFVISMTCTIMLFVVNKFVAKEEQL
jgi:hypothetical protein